MGTIAVAGIKGARAGLTPVPRRAVLVFAESCALDLARRRLPSAAARMLNSTMAARASGGFADVHFFSPAPHPVRFREQFHRQVGTTFGQRLENAIERLHALGYDEIAAVGRDCPSLRASDILSAFEQLEHNQLVLGPDHRGGCYLIAFRLIDRALLRGIRWNRNSDCAELRARCPESRVFLLAQQQDIDSWADLRLFARLGHSLSALADFLLRVLCMFVPGRADFFDPAAHFARVRGQMPPPAFAG